MTELNASGVVEDAGFVAGFEGYRTALAEHGPIPRASGC